MGRESLFWTTMLKFKGINANFTLAEFITMYRDGRNGPMSYSTRRGGTFIQGYNRNHKYLQLARHPSTKLAKSRQRGWLKTEEGKERFTMPVGVQLFSNASDIFYQHKLTELPTRPSVLVGRGTSDNHLRTSVSSEASIFPNQRQWGLGCRIQFPSTTPSRWAEITCWGQSRRWAAIQLTITEHSQSQYNSQSQYVCWSNLWKMLCADFGGSRD